MVVFMKLIVYKHSAVIIVMAAIISILFLFTGCSPNNAKTTPEVTESNAQGENQGSDKNEEPIVFTDEVFEKLLKTELGTDKIYPSDLEEITGIQIAADQFLFLSGPNRPSRSIILFKDDTFEYEDQKYTGFGTMKSLNDLSYFPKLSVLKITLQPDIDYNTIPNMSQLVQINITQSKVTDIAFLSEGEKLTYVILSTNNIKEIRSLENCKKLKYLSVNFNDVSDISPLADLITLEKVYFYENAITDITPLSKLTALQEIGMYNNMISDISVLSGLKNLTYVEFINNKITDVSPLKNFSSFERLALTGNPIENIELLSHIENIEFE